MKVKLNLYEKKENNSIHIEPETEFERSVWDNLFGEGGIIVYHYATGACLTKMPEDILKILNKYLKKKEAEKNK